MEKYGYNIDNYDIIGIINEVKNWFCSKDNISNDKIIRDKVLIEIINNNQRGKILVKKS